MIISLQILWMVAKYEKKILKDATIVLVIDGMQNTMIDK